MHVWGTLLSLRSVVLTLLGKVGMQPGEMPTSTGIHYFSKAMDGILGGAGTGPLSAIWKQLGIQIYKKMGGSLY